MCFNSLSSVLIKYFQLKKYTTDNLTMTMTMTIVNVESFSGFNETLNRH